MAKGHPTGEEYARPLPEIILNFDVDKSPFSVEIRK
jgi:hypothetical protein